MQQHAIKGIHQEMRSSPDGKRGRKINIKTDNAMDQSDQESFSYIEKSIISLRGSESFMAALAVVIPYLERKLDQVNPALMAGTEDECGMVRVRRELRLKDLAVLQAIQTGICDRAAIDDHLNWQEVCLILAEYIEDTHAVQSSDLK